ncbi:MAG TPA: signal peptidase I [Kiritimatiellia bacterium]|nr:signal peptidase I [Kiritimatiellia bacterium]
MNYWQRRKLKKAVQHLLHEARHARHMREDIAPAAAIEKIVECENTLRDAWDKEDMMLIDQAADRLSEAVHKVYPPHPRPRLKENVEILVVAIAVAMAFRTYYVQPFRIPTGSMQPTLNGITYQEQRERGIMDYFPLKIFPFLIFGEKYVEVRAQASGVVDFNNEYIDESYVIRIAGIPHVIHRDMPRYFDVHRTVVNKGDLLASGRRQLGDHIFVLRLWYNFFPPKRGDVFVFSTRNIRHPDIRTDNYYIKRLVGMPGEKVSIQPPYLVVNGKRVTEPEVFDRQINGDGYHGYILIGDGHGAALLRRPSDSIQLGEEEYLPLGDNTRASLDGRFFGAVDRESIVGPAYMVYWPFTRRWGVIQ